MSTLRSYILQMRPLLTQDISFSTKTSSGANPGGHSLVQTRLSWTTPWPPSIFCAFSNQRGSTTCLLHLHTSSCPSCILLMALSPINKALQLAPGCCLSAWHALSPHLALQYAWGFWHAYRASSQWITNGKVFVKHTVATFRPPLTRATGVSWVEAGAFHKTEGGAKKSLKM